jgi:ABC-type branched-subunit amino acid transport system substrate-binding protein
MYKLYGDDQLVGLEGAVAYYNAHGGIDGHHVTVKHVSDNGDPTTGVSVLLQQLESGSPPTMVWAGSVAVDNSALIPVLAKKKQFAIALGDGNNQCLKNSTVTCPNEWTLADPYSTSLVSAASWMKSKGFKKVGILQETDTQSEAETPFIEQALTREGIPHTIATFPSSVTGLTPELQALKASGATAVFFEGIGAPAGYALSGRAQLGWKVPLTFDVAGAAIDLTKLVPAADTKDAYEDIYREQSPADKSVGITNLLKYSKPYGNVTAVPLDVASTGWDAVVALNDAVKEDGGSLAVNDLDAAMLKLPPTDPERTFTTKLGYTTADHENVLASPKDYLVVPVGPVTGGQVQTP